MKDDDDARHMPTFHASLPLMRCAVCFCEHIKTNRYMLSYELPHKTRCQAKQYLNRYQASTSISINCVSIDASQRGFISPFARSQCFSPIRMLT